MSDPRVSDEFPRSTRSVLAHIEAERAMQVERWGWRSDAMRSEPEWNRLIRSYLTKPGASRYIRLVQVAALALAAAERQFGLDDAMIESKLARREKQP